jgi:UDP-GlcNAc:undecaprenyl-phosphate/decaprenyl-phosphate GlcNAc-1-phosphate transferase
LIFLSTLLISILIPIALIPVFSALALRFQLVDLPNERKVHKYPIPRIGGIAMAIGALAPIMFWCLEESFVRAFLPAAAVIVAFGIVDDLRDLSPRWKLAGQFGAALIVVFFGELKITNLGGLLPEGFVLSDGVAIPLTLLVIVGVTNAINLADGLDGLAGGICLLFFSCIAYLAYLEGDTAIGLVALSLLGAIFGFLRFNTYPATVFMGDTGSQLLGFSAITLALDLTQGNTALSPVLPLILLGFPVLDTLTVMTVRIASGRSPFSADKNHFHHNLMNLGLYHSESVVVIYLIQMLLVLAAYMLRFYSDWLLLSGYLVFSAVILAAFTVSTRTDWRPQRSALLIQAKLSLKRMQNEKWVIQCVSRSLHFGVPLLLAFTLLLPRVMPGCITVVALVFPALIYASLRYKREWLGDLLRLTLYLVTPFAVYQADIAPAGFMDGVFVPLNNVLFGVFAVLNALVSKLSRRQKGFQSTPLDFLVLFIAVVVPNLPDRNLQAYHLGLVGAKVVILYYSCEVVMAELRGEYDRFAWGIVTVLAGAGCWGVVKLGGFL